MAVDSRLITAHGATEHSAEPALLPTSSTFFSSNKSADSSSSPSTSSYSSNGSTAKAYQEVPIYRTTDAAPLPEAPSPSFSPFRTAPYSDRFIPSRSSSLAFSFPLLDRPGDPPQTSHGFGAGPEGREDSAAAYSLLLKSQLLGGQLSAPPALGSTANQSLVTPVASRSPLVHVPSPRIARLPLWPSPRPPRGQPPCPPARFSAPRRLSPPPPHSVTALSRLPPPQVLNAADDCYPNVVEPPPAPDNTPCPSTRPLFYQVLDAAALQGDFYLNLVDWSSANALTALLVTSSSSPFLLPHHQVLDAPALQDDFYLNLVDWSSTNVLAVGLGSCVYLWSAASSKVITCCQQSSKVLSSSASKVVNVLAVGLGSCVYLWSAASSKVVKFRYLKPALRRRRDRRQLDGSEALPSQSHPARPFPSTRPLPCARVPFCAPLCLRPPRAGDNSGGVGPIDAVTKLVDVGPSDAVCSVSWTQRGTLLAVGTNNGHVQVCGGHVKGSGEHVTGCGGHVHVDLGALGRVGVWDVVKGRRVRSMGGHRVRVGAMAWAANVLATGSRDRSVLQRDVRSPVDFVARLTAHRSEVCGLKWSPDDRELASGGNDNQVCICGGFRGSIGCSVVQRDEVTPDLECANVTAAGGAIHAAPGDSQGHRLVAAPARFVYHPSTRPSLVFFCLPSLLPAPFSLLQLLIWSVLTSQQPVVRFTQHQAAVKAIAWSPHQHGLLASGGGTADRCIRFWNTATATPLRTATAPPWSYVDTGSQGPVGNLTGSISLPFTWLCVSLSSCLPSILALPSTHSHSFPPISTSLHPLLATLTGHTMRVLFLAVSPDGQVRLLAVW
ncbi:unnamed protein product [Closterium sp. NIES-65]|nr:unnamed protein product [Closterium sp. NIES-65]